MRGGREKTKKLYATATNIKIKAKEWMSELEDYARPFRFSPSSSALLVIDMQEFFLNENSHAFLPTSKAIIPNIKSIVNVYKREQLPVIFTRHALREEEDAGIMGRWWRDVLRDDSRFSEIVNELKADAKTVVRKTRYNAFYRTKLEKILRDKYINSLLITGVMTHLCCDTTAREAFTRDYEVFIVVDATASKNEELHLSSLRALSHGFAVPLTTEQVLKTFREMK